MVIKSSHPSKSKEVMTEKMSENTFNI